MYSSPFQSKAEKTSFAGEGGTAQPPLLPAPPQPPGINSGPFLHLPLKAEPHWAPAAPGELVEIQTQLLRSSPRTGQSHVPATPPSLGVQLRRPRCAAQQRGPVPHLGQRCCPSSSWVFNNTQAQALPCLTFAEDRLSGEAFSMSKCPAKSIFCSFFL